MNGVFLSKLHMELNENTKDGLLIQLIVIALAIYRFSLALKC